MKGCEIWRNCALIAKSRNLRGILTYARKSPCVSVDCQHLIGTTGNESIYSVTFTFSDGATGEIDFADWRVLAQFIMARRSWTTNRWTGYAPFVQAMDSALEPAKWQ